MPGTMNSNVKALLKKGCFCFYVLNKKSLQSEALFGYLSILLIRYGRVTVIAIGFATMKPVPCLWDITLTLYTPAAVVDDVLIVAVKLLV